MARPVTAVSRPTDGPPLPAEHCLMPVAPAEKALLLLIRERGYGKLTLVFRGGLPMYATQVEQRIHLGQWQGDGT